jgi:hypothetical protein
MEKKLAESHQEIPLNARKIARSADPRHCPQETTRYD